MTAPEPVLSEEEREALRDWWDGESEADTAGTMLANLDATVERILAARLAAQRKEIASDLDALRVSITSTDDYDLGSRDGLASAARMVLTGGA